MILVINGCGHLSDQSIHKNKESSAVNAGSYYEQLNSLLSRKKLKVYPKTSDRDINRIEVEKGGAGVLYGSTTDDVIAIWGKPSGFLINDIRDSWDMYIGACRFGFVENSLVYISIHNVTVPDAKFDNGISFESSIEDVLDAFGEPSKASDYFYTFRNDNGFVIKFHFTPDSKNKDIEKLIAVSIYHPDAGK